MPEDIEKLWLRVDLKSASVYRVREFHLGMVAKTQVQEMPVGNLLLNGGAERGFYGIYKLNIEEMRKKQTGRVHESNYTFQNDMSLYLDDSTSHTGKYSFRMEQGEDARGRLTFNSVPFVDGKPVWFSCWAKAAEPGQKLYLALFLGNGFAYGKEVPLTTEWKKYTIHIPVWGKPAQDIVKIGDVSKGYAAKHHLVSPNFQVRGQGTIWVDDAVYCIGEQQAEATIPALALGAKMTKESLYYFPDERVEAEISLRNTTKNTIQTTPKWTLLDFRGETLATGTMPATLLPPDQNAFLKLLVPVPKEQRGPMNLLVEANGELAGTYFGVVAARKPLSFRVGTNISAGMNNIERTIPVLQDFRIGALRLWSRHGSNDLAGHRFSFLDVDEFHDAGFEILMCVSNPRYEAPFPFLPKDLTVWKRDVQEVVAKYLGKITYYEIMNEPNIWAGRGKNTKPDQWDDMTSDINARALLEVGKAIKQVDPKAKIAGPTTCHTDITWTNLVLSKGADQILDLITEHPYRGLPELPDYESDLISLHKIANKYRKDFPIAADETGALTPAVYPKDNLIPDFALQAMAYNIRMQLVGLANDLAKYYHFQFCLSPDGTGWLLTKLGGPDNGCHANPNPTMYAIRQSIDILEDARPVGRVRLGGDYRCYVFDRGDRRVGIVWKWYGDPVQLNIPTALMDEAWYDVMGTPLHKKTLLADQFPTYIETKLSSKELMSELKKLGESDAMEKVEVTYHVTGERECLVSVKNQGGKPLSGTLSIAGQNVQFGPLASEETSEFPVKLDFTIGTESHQTPASVKLASGKTFQYNWNLRALLVPKAKKAPTMDGDLSDWKGALTFPIARPTKENNWSPIEENATAEGHLMWDDDYLYIGVVVHNKPFVESPKGPFALWHGDCIQFAFDPTLNATWDQNGFGDDDFEYSFGKADNRIALCRTYASSASYDSFDKEKGIIDEGKNNMKISKNQVVYEVALPRRSVSPFRLTPGNTMRINFLVNFANEQGRAGFLELTEGLGGKKRPGRYMDMVLLP
ncbi:MAG: hypothetical protein IJJ26_02950 [Victivallales bacterium]|nr:hypothetical protein [Victivallales bacterium]